MICGILARSLAIVITLTLACTAASAQFPGIRLEPVAGGFEQPTSIANAGDGTGRLFVVEQPGVVKIVQNGVVLQTPFLDVTQRVLTGGERGLLGIAFPPQFALKNYFYVNYTRRPDGATVVARYRVTPDPNVADPASEEVLIVVSQPFANHNGGMMAFSPVDGFLYIGLGDGGSAGDPRNFALNVRPLPGNKHFLGKLLRIDTESGAVPYAIPATNPLFAGIRSQLWARGLRNPWKFSFDRLTGDLYLGDVGQNTIEEINFRPAASIGGENYGWSRFEGTLCFKPELGCVPGSRNVFPLRQYTHALGCSVTGGYVYRGAQFPMLQGIYFYGDFCTGRLWGLRRTVGGSEKKLLALTGLQISTFGEGEDGSVFVADYSQGNLFRIVPTVVVLFPNGGERVQGGSLQTIQWDAAPGITSFDILLSRDNGLTFRGVAAGVQGDNFPWSVPRVRRRFTTCLIRIRGFDAVGNRVGDDRSDRVFRMVP
jgi:glucose/arabinose dehydrogenase